MPESERGGLPVVRRIAVLLTALGPLAPSAPGAPAPAPPPAQTIPECVRLIQAGRFDEARGILEPLVSAHPDWGRAQFTLGLTFHKEKRYGAARPYFERALALEPEYQPAHLFTAWCYYYLGELALAKTQFEAVRAADAASAEAALGLGLIALDGGETAGATNRLEEAIRFARAASDGETEYRAQTRLGDLLAQGDAPGALDAAGTAYERAAALRPEAPEIWFKIARLRERQGNSSGAAEARARLERLRTPAP